MVQTVKATNSTYDSITKVKGSGNSLSSLSRRSVQHQVSKLVCIVRVCVGIAYKNKAVRHFKQNS